ncbi:hypothetical protein [Sorangium sp. So ce388]|uniref:hypothetical protein n=1 Tax=Sorangium sp. So ce388 TaxID=3133309 RepID=UPI003F5B6785
MTDSMRSLITMRLTMSCRGPESQSERVEADVLAASTHPHPRRARTRAAGRRRCALPCGADADNEAHPDVERSSRHVALAALLS